MSYRYGSVCIRCRKRSSRVPQILTRRSQSALGLLERIPRSREQPNRMCTIPPRQKLSSPTWLAIRTWSTTRATRVVVVIIIIIIIVDKQTRKKLVLKNERKISSFSRLKIFSQTHKSFIKSLVSYDFLITTERVEESETEIPKSAIFRAARTRSILFPFAEILYTNAREYSSFKRETSLHVSSLIRSVRDTIFAQIIISFTGL